MERALVSFWRPLALGQMNCVLVSPVLMAERTNLEKPLENSIFPFFSSTY